MSEFKLCENGHYFPDSLAECPYCPKKGGMMTAGDSDFGNPHFDTDVGFSGQGFGNAALNRTQIFSDAGGLSTPSQFNFVQQSYTQGRKLAGWLVSFTIDPNGADYRLYEGRNVIGSDQACDIIVPNDPAVSGKHLTILHRMGHFKFRDELSTNGTFVNDVFEEEGNLKDGDIIRIGDTIFKFRSIA
ncbi:MAG TPA: hypothetical protein DCM08_09445 [Microscillaceae bacterium]|jgi:hypothetical protein|nr:hypothetical protein [Microscillaceae bacterium]